MAVSVRKWIRTNLRTLVLTTLGVWTLRAQACAQMSATGCAALTEADAVATPAVVVGSGWTLRAMLAPYGLPGLSAGYVHTAIVPEELAVFARGRGADGWTDLGLGARYRWRVDTAFAVGIRATADGSWFRGFAPHAALRIGAHALATREAWRMGMTIDDLVVAGTPTAPWIRFGMGHVLTDGMLAADVVMGPGREFGLLISAQADASPLTIAGSVLTAPFTLQVALRMPVQDDLTFAIAVRFVEGLGLDPGISAVLP
jgi:hypothetical protein